MHLGTSLLVASASHLAECPDLGPRCFSNRPPVPYNHHVSLVVTDFPIDMAFGITPWLAAEARVSVRVVDTTPTYTERDGSPKQVPNDIHHHDETLAGPTDPWLVLRFGGATGKLVAAARLGTTIPIGKTEEDPYALGREGKRHEHIQFGSGTFMPIVGLGLSYRLDPIEIDVTATGVFSLYENEHTFRAPSRLYPELRVTWPFAKGALRPAFIVDLPCETGERWNAKPGEEGPDGRVDLLLGAGIAWKFARSWTADLTLRARIAQLTEGAGYDYPGTLAVGVGTEFDLGGKGR